MTGPTTGTHNQSLGTWGEGIALRYLLARGLVLLDRNWRCREGELDLVLRDGNTLVACEVKTRTSADYGHPIEAVGPAKAERLRVLVDLWARAHGVRPPDLRVDVVGVVQSGPGAPELEYVRGFG